ncbi:MAG: histidine phosphatase family protein [Anaerolineales bacterium]
MITHCLIFVRHAHADWIPNENRPLSTRGAQDATHVAEILSNISIQRVFSSPYRRAYQTVEPLSELKNLDITIDERLRERDLGSWEAKSFQDAVHRTWDDFDFSFRDGETNHDTQARGIAAVQQIITGGYNGPIVISTHGNLLALILNYFHPHVDYTFWRALTMPDIYQLVWTQENQVERKRLWKPAVNSEDSKKTAMRNIV